jgi:anthranilate synthase/phosphoribosyltransferase
MVLVIDNFDSFTYNLVQVIASLGREVRVFRNDAITPEQAESLHPEAVVISPGPGTPEQAGVSIAMIRRLAGQAPILGVCLGHQAIGAAFGARIVKAQALMHGKTSEIEHDGLTIFSGLPPGFPAARYHSLAVDQHTLPDCFEVSAWTADREIMGLRHRSLEVEGVQFHPESVATPVGRKLLENFLERRKQASAADLRSAIARAVEGRDLSREEMEAAMRLIMSGEATQAQIGSLLTALRLKGESVEEIAAAAGVMREKATRVVRPADRVVVDTCGTGGDGAHTFNISTLAAFVTAGAGITVAKHGNRALSSRCGSADVLRELGVDIGIDAAAMSRCLQEVGIGFLFAPSLHSAMRHVVGPRREIGVRTIFNILGPLSNPAGADAQVVGVYDRKLVPVLARVLGSLGLRRAVVVHGSDGLDEITLTGPTFAAWLDDGKVEEREIDPSTLGLAPCRPEDLAGGDPTDNAALARAILEGRDRGPRRSIVALNAAAAIYAAGAAADLAAGLARAERSLESGAALDKLERLKAATRG